MNDIGHNRPPADLLLGDALRDRLLDAHLKLLDRRDQLLAAEERIPAIDSDDIAANVSDFIKQIMAASKAAEGARVAEKEPYLDGGRGIDGFFKAISDPLDQAKARIQRSLTGYLREKAERERKAREELERQAREEEARLRREAEAAERKIRDEQSLKAGIEAEKRAKAAEADRIAAEAAARAKAAELSRTRGEFGALASLRTTWAFEDVDRRALDLEALRDHLPMDGLERAIRSFIKAGGRELRGVHIFETENATVR